MFWELEVPKTSLTRQLHEIIFTSSAPSSLIYFFPVHPICTFPSVSHIQQGTGRSRAGPRPHSNAGKVPCSSGTSAQEVGGKVRQKGWKKADPLQELKEVSGSVVTSLHLHSAGARVEKGKDSPRGITTATAGISRRWTRMVVHPHHLQEAGVARGDMSPLPQDSAVTTKGGSQCCIVNEVLV